VNRELVKVEAWEETRKRRQSEAKYPPGQRLATCHGRRLPKTAPRPLRPTYCGGTATKPMQRAALAACHTAN
ncbi:hypothetical protein HAX54_022088, partial [Datura stramonium]|nr:hypothetical protein [Datura stramonium]